MKPLIITLSAFFAIFAGTARAEFRYEEDFSLPVVEVNIEIETGAATDPADKLGLANIAAQMLLTGTQKHSKSEFSSLINRIGGEFTTEVRSEGIIFTGAVLAENVDKFFELLTEAFTRPKFDAAELKKLKQEVIGRIIERKSDDRALVQYSFQRFFYGSHPYGNPSSGTQAGVEAITNKDVLDFYTNYFGGEAVHLFGSGAVKQDVIQKWYDSLKDRLTALHPGAKPAAKVARPEIPKTRRALIVDTPNATQSQILIGGPGIRPEMKGFYAVQLANHAFGGPSFDARLMRELRVKRGWTYGAYNNFKFGQQPRDFETWLFPKTADTVPAVELTLSLLADFVKNGITKPEYDFAKQSLVNNAPFNYDTPRKRVENATNEFVLNFPRNFYKDLADHYSDVSFDELLPAVKSLVDPENVTLVVVGDAKRLKEAIAKIPGFSDVKVKNYLED